jgi:hypothetical protein
MLSKVRRMGSFSEVSEARTYTRHYAGLIMRISLKSVTCGLTL